MTMARTFPSPHSRPSLYTRISEERTRATLPAQAIRPAPRTVQSFTERYRGTEFETHFATSRVTREPIVSRGRAFVLLAGIATSTLLGILLGAMPA